MGIDRGQQVSRDVGSSFPWAWGPGSREQGREADFLWSRPAAGYPLPVPFFQLPCPEKLGAKFVCGGCRPPRVSLPCEALRDRAEPQAGSGQRRLATWLGCGRRIVRPCPVRPGPCAPVGRAPVSCSPVPAPWSYVPRSWVSGSRAPLFCAPRSPHPGPMSPLTVPCAPVPCVLPLRWRSLHPGTQSAPCSTFN